MLVFTAMATSGAPTNCVLINFIVKGDTKNENNLKHTKGGAATDYFQCNIYSMLIPKIFRFKL